MKSIKFALSQISFNYVYVILNNITNIRYYYTIRSDFYFDTLKYTIKSPQINTTIKKGFCFLKKKKHFISTGHL